MEMYVDQREHRLGVLRFPRASRLPRVPLWAVIIIIIWLGLVGLCEWLEPAGANAPSLCKVKAITGIACPTCGTTRAVKAAADGHLLDAWLFNLFVVTALMLAATWLVFRFTTGRSIQFVLPKGLRAVAWITVGLLFAANWVYLIARGM